MESKDPEEADNTILRENSSTMKLQTYRRWLPVW
jgi:hypothetical protein